MNAYSSISRFFLNNIQRKLELQYGLPLSPVMDQSNLVDCQVKFLSFAMLPLAQTLITLIPTLNVSPVA